MTRSAVLRLVAPLALVAGVLGLAAGPALAAAPGSAAAAAPRAVSAADPTGTGVIAVRMTLDGKPLAGSVTLTATQDGAVAFARTSETRPNGQVEFPALPTGQEWSYVATTNREGITFSTDRVEAVPKETTVVLLPVFATTTDAADVSLASWLVWVDVEGSTMAVQQDVEIVNSGTTAYIGSIEVAGSKDKNNAAIELPLAPEAANMQYLGRFETCCAVASATSWAHTRPVNPGTSTGTLRYEAPTAATLTFPVTLPTKDFTLLVPQGTAVTSPTLQPAGTSTDRGITYDLYRAGPLAKGSTVEVTLGSAAGSSAAWWPWALGAVVLVVLLGLLAWWWRGRRAAADGPGAMTASVRPAKPSTPAASKASARPAPSKPATTKVSASKASTSKAPTAKPAPSTPSPATPAESADLLADELAMLDLAWENGALTDEAAYQRVRASIVDRMVRALRRGDALTR